MKQKEKTENLERQLQKKTETVGNAFPVFPNASNLPLLNYVANLSFFYPVRLRRATL